MSSEAFQGPAIKEPPPLVNTKADGLTPDQEFLRDLADECLARARARGLDVVASEVVFRLRSKASLSFTVIRQQR